jgi:hypothetical protein
MTSGLTSGSSGITGLATGSTVIGGVTSSAGC